MFEKRKEKKNAKWTATTIIVTGAFICMSSSSSGPSDNFVAAAVAVVAVCKNWFSKFTLLLCPKYSLFFFCWSEHTSVRSIVGFLFGAWTQAFEWVCKFSTYTQTHTARMPKETVFFSLLTHTLYHYQSEKIHSKTFSKYEMNWNSFFAFIF